MIPYGWGYTLGLSTFLQHHILEPNVYETRMLNALCSNRGQIGYSNEQPASAETQIWLSIEMPNLVDYLSCELAVRSGFQKQNTKLILFFTVAHREVQSV